MKTKKATKLLALLLSVMMLASMIPISAAAADPTDVFKITLTGSTSFGYTYSGTEDNPDYDEDDSSSPAMITVEIPATTPSEYNAVEWASVNSTEGTMFNTSKVINSVSQAKNFIKMAEKVYTGSSGVIEVDRGQTDTVYVGLKASTGSKSATYGYLQYLACLQFDTNVLVPDWGSTASGIATNAALNIGQSNNYLKGNVSNFVAGYVSNGMGIDQVTPSALNSLAPIYGSAVGLTEEAESTAEYAATILINGVNANRPLPEAADGGPSWDIVLPFKIVGTGKTTVKAVKRAQDPVTTASATMLGQEVNYNVTTLLKMGDLANDNTITKKDISAADESADIDFGSVTFNITSTDPEASTGASIGATGDQTVEVTLRNCTYGTITKDSFELWEKGEPSDSKVTGGIKSAQIKASSDNKVATVVIDGEKINSAKTYYIKVLQAGISVSKDLSTKTIKVQPKPAVTAAVNADGQVILTGVTQKMSVKIGNETDFVAAGSDYAMPAGNPGSYESNTTTEQNVNAQQNGTITISGSNAYSPTGTVTYALQGEPDGFSIAPNTGVITLTDEVPATTAGNEYEMTVVLTDDNNGGDPTVKSIPLKVTVIGGRTRKNMAIVAAGAAAVTDAVNVEKLDKLIAGGTNTASAGADPDWKAPIQIKYTSDTNGVSVQTINVPQATPPTVFEDILVNYTDEKISTAADGTHKWAIIPGDTPATDAGVATAVTTAGGWTTSVATTDASGGTSISSDIPAAAASAAAKDIVAYTVNVVDASHPENNKIQSKVTRCAGAITVRPTIELASYTTDVSDKENGDTVIKVTTIAGAAATTTTTAALKFVAEHATITPTNGSKALTATQIDALSASEIGSTKVSTIQGGGIKAKLEGATTGDGTDKYVELYLPATEEAQNSTTKVWTPGKFNSMVYEIEGVGFNYGTVTASGDPQQKEITLTLKGDDWKPIGNITGITVEDASSSAVAIDTTKGDPYTAGIQRVSDKVLKLFMTVDLTEQRYTVTVNGTNNTVKEAVVNQHQINGATNSDKALFTPSGDGYVIRFTLGTHEGIENNGVEIFTEDGSAPASSAMTEDSASSNTYTVPGTVKVSTSGSPVTANFYLDPKSYEKIGANDIVVKAYATEDGVNKDDEITAAVDISKYGLTNIGSKFAYTADYAEATEADKDASEVGKLVFTAPEVTKFSGKVMLEVTIKSSINKRTLTWDDIQVVATANPGVAAVPTKQYDEGDALLAAYGLELTGTYEGIGPTLTGKVVYETIDYDNNAGIDLINASGTDALAIAPTAYYGLDLTKGTKSQGHITQVGMTSASITVDYKDSGEATLQKLAEALVDSEVIPSINGTDLNNSIGKLGTLLGSSYLDNGEPNIDAIVTWLQTNYVDGKDEYEDGLLNPATVHTYDATATSDIAITDVMGGDSITLDADEAKAPEGADFDHYDLTVSPANAKITLDEDGKTILIAEDIDAIAAASPAITLTLTPKKADDNADTSSRTLTIKIGEVKAAVYKYTFSMTSGDSLDIDVMKNGASLLAANPGTSSNYSGWPAAPSNTGGEYDDPRMPATVTYTKQTRPSGGGSSIYFDGEEYGTPSEDEVDLNNDNKVDGDLPSFNCKKGLYFLGWTTEKGNENKIVTSSKEFEDGQTLYPIVKGYVSGTGAGKFEPNRNVSRAELATMLVIASGGYDPNKDYGKPSFSDAQSGWYAPFIAAAEKAGFFSGDNGKARPKDAITRQEAASMIARAFPDNVTVVKGATTEYVIDFDKVPGWASDVVAALCNAGVINGKPVAGTDDTAFKGTDKIKRSEVTQMVNKFLIEDDDKAAIKGTSPFSDVKNTSVWYYNNVLFASKSVDGKYYSTEFKTPSRK